MLARVRVEPGSVVRACNLLCSVSTALAAAEISPSKSVVLTHYKDLARSSQSTQSTGCVAR